MSKKYKKIDKDDIVNNKDISELDTRPLESIFLKSLRKKIWYKKNLFVIFFIYLFPINFKIRLEQQLEIFIRYFNRSYNSKFHIENLESDFFELYKKHIQTPPLRWVIFIYLAILTILTIILIILGVNNII